MEIQNQIALWADELRDISSLGLMFSDDIHDKDRYKRIQDISIGMTSIVTNTQLEDLEPLRKPIFSRPTPLSASDGAIIDDSGKILLVQRGDNESWSMPGGALEVGETPSEGVIREILEETGFQCQVKKLIGVYDSRLVSLDSSFHIYLFTFLCSIVIDAEQIDRQFPDEIIKLDWFPEDGLPKPIHRGHHERIIASFKCWKNDAPVYFD